MTKTDFTMWLNGWVEISGGQHPTVEQWEMIKQHLALAFNKVTPPLGGAPMAPSNRLSLDLGKLGLNDLSKVPPVFPQPFFVPPANHIPGTVYC